jgi:hypothetical protein
MLIVVSPDKSIESLDGHIPLDLMTNATFSGALPKSMTSMNRFKEKSSTPHMTTFDRSQSNRDFMIDINKDETDAVRRKYKMDKSPSLETMAVSPKKKINPDK